MRNRFSLIKKFTLVAELKKYGGTQFKNEIVDAFLRIDPHNSRVYEI